MTTDETASEWLKSALGGIFKDDGAPGSSSSSSSSKSNTTSSTSSSSVDGLMSLFSSGVGSAEQPPASTHEGGSPQGAGDGGDDFWSSLAARAASAAAGDLNLVGSSPEAPPALEVARDSLDTLDVEALSIKDLRALIKRAGMSDAACVEKVDIVAAARRAVERLREAKALQRRGELAAASSDARTGAAAAAAGVGQRHGKHPRRVLSGLECVILGERVDPATGHPEPADFLLFCFHGYQATAASLAPLADVVRASVVHGKGGGRASGGRLIVVLPQAAGAGWWDIDFASYAFAMAMGEAAKGRALRAVPAGVPACRALVAGLVRECRALYADPAASSPSARLAVPAGRTFFMGFSQGAMLALDAALQMEEAPVGGCVLVSGFLMDVETWAARLAGPHRDLRALQLHGLADPLIPFGTAKWLQALLAAHSSRAVFVPHGGGHDIPPHVLTTVAGFLAAAMV